MRWLADASAATVTEALRAVAPELSAYAVVVPEFAGRDEPLWQGGSARVGDGFVAKFAWSHPAALRIAHEIGVLNALSGSAVPFLPEVVAAATDPVLLVTRRVTGASLFQVADAIDRDRAGRQLAEFLAALHRPEVLGKIRSTMGVVPAAQDGPQHPPPARVLRERFAALVRPEQARIVDALCDRAESIVAEPGPGVLVHADLHGDNQVWQGERLRLVVDFETAGVGEPEYDLRALAGIGPGGELLAATMRHYEEASGRGLSADRVLAWHALTALGDALWRCEAGVPLADGRTAGEIVDEVASGWNLAS